MQTRSGLSSVNQDLNNQIQKSLMCVNPRNEFYDASMNKVATTAVQQVCDLAFYKRGNRWVDSRLIAGPEDDRERSASSNSARRNSAIWRPGWSVKAGQGSIALRGDILMLVDGRPVLIKAPSDKP